MSVGASFPLTGDDFGGGGSGDAEAAIRRRVGARRMRGRGHAGPVPRLGDRSRSRQGSGVWLRALGVTPRLGRSSRRAAGVLFS